MKVYLLVLIYLILLKKIKERAVGQEVLESLTPAQAVIKIVNEELTALMGQTQSHINISPKSSYNHHDGRSSRGR